MSSFFGLQIGLSALRAHQRSLETISHNVANVNTEHYSRQEVVLTPQWLSSEGRTGRGYQGAGVDVAGIQRYASSFLSEQIRRESGEEARWEVLSDTLRRVQALFHEPSEEGLGAILDHFWASWKELGTDPTNVALRSQVRESARQLASLMQQRYRDLLGLQRELTRRIQDVVRQVNDLASRIADVDRQIQRGMATGSPPNDLLDQRDQLLGELGRMVKVSSFVRENGGITVSVGGHLLVSEQGVSQIEVAPDPSNGEAVVPRWAEDGTTVRVLGGELAGLLEARDNRVSSYIGSLHELAGALIDAVNAVHRTGYGLNNATGLEFFTGSGASDIAVAPSILDDLGNIAAASAPDAPGDGSRALDIAQLANRLLISGGTTLGGFYNTMIALVGMGVQQSEAASRNQALLLDHLKERRDALSGVSLDEEAVKLIGSQRAYEAAARVITAVDEMLDQLIHGTGIVGR
ncbi:MAG: flagellar hook-associated protein FlgK [Anaerolineae bacterium]|nr:flagellar hook-associated protein FlgK [Anaerolineae bacterium]